MNHGILPANAIHQVDEAPNAAAAPVRPPPLERRMHDRIAQRAYDLYIQSGSLKGRCRENWHRAEQLLEAESIAPTSRVENGEEIPPAPFDGATPILRRTPPTRSIRNGKTAHVNGKAFSAQRGRSTTG